MSENIDYLSKYIKYKNKYIMLKNHHQSSGAMAARYIEFLDVDELSVDTQSLVTTGAFRNINWNHYSDFEKLVTSFGVNIITLTTVGQEWGQDFISNIKLNSEGQMSFKLVTRDPYIHVKEEFNRLLPNSISDYLSLPENTNEYNLKKGGNFITLPNKVRGVLPDDDFDDYPREITKKIITLVPDVTEDSCIYTHYLCLKVYLPKFKLETYYGADVFHIDEILTLIPTGPTIDDYDIWFYNPVCEEDHSYHTALQVIFNYNYDMLRRFFPQERIRLFNLHFTPDGILLYPPIFNRVLLRRNNRFRIIFPDQQNDQLKQQVINEMRRHSNIDYHFINTDMLHRYSGNIHCGFKNIPKTY